MLRFKFTFFCVVLVGLTTGCSYFERSDYLKTVQLSDDEQTSVIYKLYQTGIDNFRYEFKFVSESDTIELFEAYLNDAKAVENFTVETGSSKFNILTTQNIGNQSKTLDGVQYTLMHKQ